MTKVILENSGTLKFILSSIMLNRGLWIIKKLLRN